MSFFKNFTKYEFYSVAGKRYQNVIVLTGILFISIFTVIFSTALQDYLKVKMDSPFVKFITIDNEKNESSGKKVEATLETLNEPNLISKYNINKIFGVRTGYITAINRLNSKVINSVKFRIAGDDPFCDFLLNSNSQEMQANFLTKREVAKRILTNDSTWGVIITADLLFRLGYDLSNIDFIELDYATNDGFQTISRKIPFPVLGVVKQLPDKVDMLVPFKLGTALRNVNLIKHPLLVEKSYQQDYLRLAVDPAESDGLVKNGFRKVADYPVKNLSVLQKDGLDSIQISSLNFQKLKGYKRLYKFEIDESLNDIHDDNFEKYTVYFNNLDSVRTFQSYLLDQNLYLDVDVVEAKENFNKLNKTILLILGGLILFSMYCIVLFTSNLISNHIQKNTKNLGTLKSFGMSNNSIIRVYFTISFLLIGIAFLIALSLSYVISLTSMNTLLRLIHITEPDEKIMNLQFVSMQYCIVFISTTFLIIYLRLFKALQGKTPGDLIYNR